MKRILWLLYWLFIFCLAMTTLNDEFQKLPVRTKWWLIATSTSQTIFIIVYMYYVNNLDLWSL